MTDEEFISKVVFEFYNKASSDVLLGHQFRKIASKVGGDPLSPPMEAFREHLPKIVEFWKMQLLGHKSSEKFDLISKHDYLMIRKGELGRWLTLFLETLNDCQKNHREDQSIKDLAQKWETKVSHFQKIFSKNYFG